MYLLKKVPELRGAGRGDYFTGFTGAGLALRAWWGPQQEAKRMSRHEAERTANVWPRGSKIVQIVGEP